MRRVGAAVAIGILLIGCAPVLSPSPTGNTIIIARPCDTGASADVLCAKRDDVRQGDGATPPIRVVVGASGATLTGPRYVEASGSGAFDVRLGTEAICSSDTLGTAGVSTIRTREPQGALLTLLRGHAICTVASSGVVRLGGLSVLNADGSKTQLELVGEIEAPSDAIAQFTFVTEGNGQVRLRAFSPFRLILPSGTEEAVQPGDEVVLVGARGVVERSSRRTFTPTETGVLTTQGRVLR